MSTLTIARIRRAASAVVVHVSCTTHDTYIVRYGDAEMCRECGTVVREETPGMAELDLAYANGQIDGDLYDETRDMLLGHP